MLPVGVETSAVWKVGLTRVTRSVLLLTTEAKTGGKADGWLSVSGVVGPNPAAEAPAGRTSRAPR